MPFLSTKSYPHSLGLSACFRQWKEGRSQHFLHGYPLAFKIILEADCHQSLPDFDDLDQFLEANFKNKVLVAQDDPSREMIEALNDSLVADVVVLPAVGLEAFAYQVFSFVEMMLEKQELDDRMRVHSVECRAHAGVSGIYAREDEDFDYEPSMGDAIMEDDLSGNDA